MNGSWEQGTDSSPVVKSKFAKAVEQIRRDSENPALNGGWDKNNERRVKVLWIDQQTAMECMLMVLTGKNNPHGQLRLICHEFDLANAVVVSATYDWSCRAIGFMLYHPSFEPVPECCPAPYFDQEVRWEWHYKAPDNGDTPNVVES